MFYGAFVAGEVGVHEPLCLRRGRAVDEGSAWSFNDNLSIEGSPGSMTQCGLLGSSIGLLRTWDARLAGG